MKYTYDSINIDASSETELITSGLKNTLVKFKKKGAVIGISGGIDSSVVLALCVKAFGADKVIGVMMPDQDSSPESSSLAKKLAEEFKVKTILNDITAPLREFGCYKYRDEAVRNIFPEYNDAWKMKIMLQQEDVSRLNCFYLTVISPYGEEKTKRLPLKEYLQIVSASNLKQRSRMSVLYYHAERLNYAVIGTANKNEHEQGFFVKYGDGGADIKPIAHLFKTQVYQLAEYLNIPEQILKRVPTTDTYSAVQTQEEFFFQVPFDILDRVWFAIENNFDLHDAADVLGMSYEKIEAIGKNIKQKIAGTEYLRSESLMVQKKEEQVL